MALSYGERGESGELWKQEGQTVENVKRLRHAEAEAAARSPRRELPLPGPRRLPAADRHGRAAGGRRRDPRLRPDVLITHTDTDPFNPDHPVAFRAVDRARSAGGGRRGAERVRHRQAAARCCSSSPTSPSCATSSPHVHVDITSVWERKVAAMAEMKAQAYLQTYYAQRGEQRGNHARRASGRQEVRYGESFMRVARRWSTRCDGRARTPLGSATVYEAGGRVRLVDADLRQLVPGSRAAGPARTVRCGQGDNLMVHAAMAAVQPGDVLVLTHARARARRAVRRPARDAGPGRRRRRRARRRRRPRRRGARAIGPAVWARWIRVRGATKEAPGELDVPVAVGGAPIRPGDVLVLDADGVAVVEAERVEDVLAGVAGARGAERRKRARLQAGALSWEIDGLRERFGG